MQPLHYTTTEMGFSQVCQGCGVWTDSTKLNRNQKIKVVPLRSQVHKLLEHWQVLLNQNFLDPTKGMLGF